MASILDKLEFEKMSFDVSELLDRLSINADWGKLLVAHIYLDHILTQRLVDCMPNAEIYLSAGHKSFNDKLALCQAQNLIDTEFATTLRAINNCRNRFAHRLVFDVPDELKRELFRGFTRLRPDSDVLESGGFKHFLLTIVLLAESERLFDRKLAVLDAARADLRDQLADLVFEQFREDEGPAG